MVGRRQRLVRKTANYLGIAKQIEGDYPAIEEALVQAIDVAKKAARTAIKKGNPVAARKALDHIAELKKIQEQ